MREYALRRARLGMYCMKKDVGINASRPSTNRRISSEIMFNFQYLIQNINNATQIIFVKLENHFTNIELCFPYLSSHIFLPIKPVHLFRLY